MSGLKVEPGHLAPELVLTASELNLYPGKWSYDPLPNSFKTGNRFPKGTEVEQAHNC